MNLSIGSIEIEFVAHLDTRLLSFDLGFEKADAVFAWGQRDRHLWRVSWFTTDGKIAQTEEECRGKCLGSFLVFEVETGSLGHIVELEVGLSVTKLGCIFLHSLFFELGIGQLSRVSHVL